MITPFVQGSDIKELNVVEYARQRGLDDPAIISAVSHRPSDPFELCFAFRALDSISALVGLFISESVSNVWLQVVRM